MRSGGELFEDKVTRDFIPPKISMRRHADVSGTVCNVLYVASDANGKPAGDCIVVDCDATLL